MLDRTKTASPDAAGAPSPDDERARAEKRSSQLKRPSDEQSEKSESGIANTAQRIWRFLAGHIFSSLARRIVVLIVVVQVVQVGGFLLVSQFRAGLIEARVQSLEVQGEIIANAIASAAASDSDYSFFDQDRPLELRPGESFGPSDEGMSGLEFSINPERVGRVLHRLISPTKTRAFIYDRNGSLINDSRDLFQPGEILQLDLPPPGKIGRASCRERV